MQYRISQTTEFLYSRPANDSINQLRLRPLTDSGQVCRNFVVTVSVPARLYDFRDYWGNPVTMLYIHQAHTSLTIQTEAEVQVRPAKGLAAGTVPAVNHRGAPIGDLPDTPLPATRPPVTNDRDYRARYAEFLTPTPHTALRASQTLEGEDAIWRNTGDVLAYADQLSSLLYAAFEYSQGATTVTTTAADFMQDRRGVCQDFAHLMLALCRRRGIAARYVSGYLYCGEDSALRGDAAMHAWVEVHTPVSGWVGFDPTNHVRAGNGHIRVATGRDYADIAPVKGVVSGGGRQQSGGSVSVQNLMSVATTAAAVPRV